MVTRAELMEWYHYDPDTGLFTFRMKRGGRNPGETVGSLMRDGYWCLRIRRTQYAAHRLAWLYVYGVWPSTNLDHINLRKSDNRIANLRLASPSENNANTALNRSNTSGFKGITRVKSGKWQAGIGRGYRYTYLGLYSTPEAAHAAYMEAARRIYGEFARAG